MPEARLNDTEENVASEERILRVDQELEEQTLTIEEDREADADFRKLSDRPGFQLMYNEGDIPMFGFVGAVYIGAVQSGLNYVSANAQWLANRPMERKALMREFENDINAAAAARREAAAQAMAAPDVQKRKKQSPEQAVETNAEIEGQKKTFVQDARQSQGAKVAVDTEEKKCKRTRKHSFSKFFGRGKKKDQSRTAQQIRQQSGQSL